MMSARAAVIKFARNLRGGLDESDVRDLCTDYMIDHFFRAHPGVIREAVSAYHFKESHR